MSSVWVPASCGHGHILRNDDCSNPHLHIHRRQFLEHIARIKHYLTSNTHLHSIIRPHSVRTICKGHKSALMNNPLNAIRWIVISIQLLIYFFSPFQLCKKIFLGAFKNFFPDITFLFLTKKLFGRISPN